MDASVLILASTSPFRRELLLRLGIPFETVAPPFDEIPPPPGPSSPDQIRSLVLENARGKAASVGRVRPSAWVLASDQLGECEGRALSKPGTAERAVEQLSFLAGKEHRLHTAVVLRRAQDGRTEAEVVTAHLRVRPLGAFALRRYVDLERPLGCAGSYRIEGLGIALFESVRCEDPTAVIGLPLIATCRLLEWAGLSPLAPPPVPPGGRGGAGPGAGVAG
jgi:septum formation protein